MPGQLGGFIATSSITLGRISRITPRSVASSEAVATAKRRREPRRKMRAVAMRSRMNGPPVNTENGQWPNAPLSRCPPLGH